MRQQQMEEIEYLDLTPKESDDSSTMDFLGIEQFAVDFDSGLTDFGF